MNMLCFYFFTRQSVIFPTQQQLSLIYGQFIEQLGQGVVTTKLNLYLCLKKS